MIATIYEFQLVQTKNVYGITVDSEAYRIC
jgi:hypothetical protein